MSLEKIYETINSYNKKEPFSFILNKETTGTDAITQFLEKTINCPEIYMKCVEIHGAGKSVSVQGKAKLYDMDDLQTTVVFQETDGYEGIDISLTAVMPTSWKFEIPGMDWFIVSGFTIFLQSEGSDAVISGNFSMEIWLGKTCIPISVSLPVDSNGWLVKSNFEKVDLAGGLFDLAKMVGLESMGTILPPGLDQVIKSLTITDFEIFFSPENRNVHYISLQVELKEEGGSGGKWDVIKGKIGLESIKLYVKVSQPTDNKNRSVTFIVGGVLMLGGQSIPISIQNIEGGDEWSMQVMKPGGIILPGITDFAGWIGGESQDLTKGLPSGLEILDKILLYSFDIGLNIKEKSVTALDLTIGRTEPWLLPNLDNVSLQEIEITLRNASLPDQTERRTSGSVYGKFNIAGVDVLVCADQPSGNAGWQFKGRTGKGQAVRIGTLITDLVDKFDGAEEPDLPEALAGLVISDLSVSFNTNSKDFQFSGEADFPFGEQTLAITLNIDVSHPKDTYEIKVSAQFDVQLDENTSLLFDLIFEHGEANTLLASYHSEGVQPLNISALVKAVEPGEFGEFIDRLDIEIEVKSLLLAFYKEGEEEQKNAKTQENKPKATSSEGQTTAGDKSAKKPVKTVFSLAIGTSMSLSDLPLVGDQLPQTICMDDLQMVVALQSFGKEEVKSINNLLPKGVVKLPAGADDSKDEEKTSEKKETKTGAEEEPALAKGLHLSARLKLGEAEKKDEGEDEEEDNDEEGNDKSIPLLLSIPFGEEAKKKEQPAQEALLAKAQSYDLAIIEDSQTGTQNESQTAIVSTQSPAAPAVKWIKIQKSYGPVRFERIGFQYQEQVLWFLMDASLSVGGLSLSLDGLGFGSSISRFDPKFDLQGLGIAFKQGQIEIGGAFLKKNVPATGNTPAHTEYAGKAILKFKKLNLSAIGSYANLDGQPSMFIYAVMDYPLGGPSFFFVTGLAAGFGYNRSLVIPKIEDVEKFPLVAEARGKAPVSTDQTNLSDELAKIQPYVPVKAGEYFLTAGVHFTSFKMVDTFALLAVSFGNNLEINLLGISKMEFPKPNSGKSCLANIEVAFKASFIPDEGFLGVIAQLTSSSYIFSKDCHLTGGLAFYSWFSGEHSGDFVLSIGGYHSDYNAPAHYPQVPRLALNWQVNGNLSIKGEGYFALTPVAMMAGGLLEANWTSGNLRAWFRAKADFLLIWKPFHYDASFHVGMGVSYAIHTFFGTFRISADLGADLHIWGPDFTGIAHVHLWFITFNVSFGAEKNDLPSHLKWAEFEESFLPDNPDQPKLPKEVLTTSITDGLSSKGSANKNGRIHLGVINPNELCLAVDSVVPIKTCQNVIDFADGHPPAAPVKKPVTSFGNVPMGLTGEKASQFQTTLTIEISQEDNPKPSTGDFLFEPICKNVPAGLWGTQPHIDLKSEPLVKDVFSGVEIRPKPGDTPNPRDTEKMDCSNLSPAARQGKSQNLDWKKDFQVLADPELADSARRKMIKDSLSQAAGRRGSILEALGLGSEKITLSEKIVDDFLIAPLIEA